MLYLSVGNQNLTAESHFQHVSLLKPDTADRYRGYPCFRLAAIFAGMLYSVQIIQKSSTQNIMHVNIIVLKLPAKLHGVID